VPDYPRRYRGENRRLWISEDGLGKITVAARKFSQSHRKIEVTMAANRRRFRRPTPARLDPPWQAI
jgi:hypothetical protein